MNAVEIEEAISKLAGEPFDGQAFPWAFLEAFGNKATTINRLRSGSSNASDVEGGVLQRNNIHVAVMRDGAVVQRGTPDELYESPADIYVAGKIGSPHMNILKAVVGSDAKSLETPFGVMAAKGPAASAGEAALIGIRPSDIRLAALGETAIPSRIHLLEPLGDVTIVSVEAKNEMLRMVLPEASATTMKPGDYTSIVIDPAKIHIFRAASGQAMT